MKRRMSIYPAARLLESLGEWGPIDWAWLFQRWKRRMAHLPARSTVRRALLPYRAFSRTMYFNDSRPILSSAVRGVMASIYRPLTEKPVE